MGPKGALLPEQGGAEAQGQGRQHQVCLRDDAGGSIHGLERCLLLSRPVPRDKCLAATLHSAMPEIFEQGLLRTSWKPVAALLPEMGGHKDHGSVPN